MRPFTLSKSDGPIRWPEPLYGYGFAVVATTAATGLRLLTQLAFGFTVRYLIYYLLSIVASAWYAGLGPALLATALAGLAALASTGAGAISTTIGEIVFWVAAVGVAWLIVQQRNTQWRLENEIRERERARERERIALDAGHMGAWEWDIAGGKVTWSPNLERIHGLDPGAFGGAFDDFRRDIHPDDRGRVLHGIEAAVKARSDYEVEYRIVTPVGDVRWLEARGRVFLDAAGEPERMAGVCMDVTGRKQVEEKLLQAQKLESLGILAGGIAHDFNNLLTGILGNASLLADELHAHPEARRLAQSAIEAAQQAAHLTRQMLAYSGRSRFVTERINCSQQVRAITSLLAASIPKNVVLQQELADGLPAIEADAGQLQQLIMNLVINGAEAVGAVPGSVTVSTRVEQVSEEFLARATFVGDVSPGAYVLFEVRDTGCGMDDATVARIFDPFFTTKFTGRGLGLAAVLGIVRGHKGAINVRSRPGGGTTFQVLFPAARGEAHAPTPSTAEPAAVGRGTILVVDGEEIVRCTAKFALERYGYRVLLASDGREALETFARRSGDVSLVLLDITMPSMDGEATFRELRKIRPDAAVLGSSGYSEAEALARFGDGLSGFIQKPYTAERLAQKVQSCLASFCGAALDGGESGNHGSRPGA